MSTRDLHLSCHHKNHISYAARSELGHCGHCFVCVARYGIDENIASGDFSAATWPLASITQLNLLHLIHLSEQQRLQLQILA